MRSAPEVVRFGTGRRFWNTVLLCALRNWEYVIFLSVLWKEERTTRKCKEVTLESDYNENVLDFGMASSTKLFLMDIKGNMTGLKVML